MTVDISEISKKNQPWVLYLWKKAAGEKKIVFLTKAERKPPKKRQLRTINIAKCVLKRCFSNS